MVGLGVGNVLGVPQESWPRHLVEASYPDGIREIELEPGEPDDDDLAQAIILGEAAIEAGADDLDVEKIGRRFWEWAEENGRGIGIQTADVLSRIGGAIPRCARGGGVRARVPTGQSALEAARRVWEESGRYSAGNGAVMRCSPLAIRWLRDDVGLARNTALSVVTTHADPRCIWSSILVNVAVAMSLRGEDVVVLEALKRTCRAARELCDSLEVLGIAGTVPETVVDACSIAGGIAPADVALDGHEMGYTLKAMQVALWCATQASGFEEALVAVISAGGDTDTNGAIGGAVLGARFGLKAIPDRWREHERYRGQSLESCVGLRSCQDAATSLRPEYVRRLQEHEVGGVQDVRVQKFARGGGAFLFEDPLQGGTGVNDDALERHDGSAGDVVGSSVPQFPNQLLDGFIVVVRYRCTDGVEARPCRFAVDPDGHRE